MSPRGMGHATVAVLRAVADGHAYGFDVIDRTGLPSGTVYPALASLSRRGLVKARWEAQALAREQGRPRRRYYQLTPSGRSALCDALERLQSLGLAVGTLPPTPAPAEG
jgi:PadR family transcriptional regulator